MKNNLSAPGNNITLQEDIEITSAITLNVSKTGDIVLDLNGHNLICNGRISTAMINVTSSNSRFTMNFKIIDSQNNGTASHGFINSETNKVDSNSSCRAIQFMSTTVSGKVNFEIDGIKIDGFKTSGLGAAININAVAIQDEENFPNVIIKNSIITNNTAGNSGGAINLGRVNATLENNNISYNSTHGNNTREGGGLSILYSNLTMKNNVIEHNQADSGGGVYISTNSTYARSTALKILLDNNKINYNIASSPSNNNTDGLGGGLQLVLENDTDVDIKINSGEFIGNVAKDGGAIYHGVVWSTDRNNYNDTTKIIYLKKALITGNKAARGGGIWLCPQAYLLMHATLGGAIYGNTATGTFSNAQSGLLNATGDDIRYEGDDGNDKQYSYYPRSMVTVSDRTWSGNLINWYKDEESARYSDGNHILANKEYYTDTTKSFSLHGITADSETDATLIIRDNEATQRGGGIFTNNLIVIGEDEDIDIEVNKEFLKDGQPYENKIADEVKIYINLYRIDEAGNEVLLDKNIELNKENDFTYKFTDLPTKYVDEENHEHDYKYDIREVDTSNQVSNTCTSLSSTKTCTITNEYVAPPVEFVPSVEKKVTGKTKPKKDASFTFEISSEEQDGVELPKNTKVTVKGEGRVNFGNIKITKAGEYNFTIKEVLGNNLDYKYDLSVWMVKVVVGENTENGTLYIDSIKYYKKNKEYEEVVFENEYNPSTGDPLLSNVSSFIISGFVILGISIIKRKIYN